MGLHHKSRDYLFQEFVKRSYRDSKGAVQKALLSIRPDEIASMKEALEAHTGRVLALLSSLRRGPKTRKEAENDCLELIRRYAPRYPRRDLWLRGKWAHPVSCGGRGLQDPPADPQGRSRSHSRNCRGRNRGVDSLRFAVGPRLQAPASGRVRRHPFSAAKTHRPRPLESGKRCDRPLPPPSAGGAGHPTRRPRPSLGTGQKTGVASQARRAQGANEKETRKNA
jgi:hypothetical protein